MVDAVRQPLRLSLTKSLLVVALVLASCSQPSTKDSPAASTGLIGGRTTRLSSVGQEVDGSGASTSASISGDGRLVAFQSEASNLVGDDTNEAADVFVRDVAAGKTTRVSVGGTGESITPDISDDGNFVAFASFAGDLLEGDTNQMSDIFVRDMAAARTERVSVGTANAQADDFSFAPTISADGRLVVYESDATNLVPDDSNQARDIFLRDRMSGTTQRLSGAGGGSGGDRGSFGPSISGNGRFVAFESDATNLVPGDTNDARDIFVRDLETDVTQRITMGERLAQPDDSSYAPTISADGQVVAFSSRASNLVPGDTNGSEDIFIRRRSGSGTMVVVSSPPGKDQADADSYAPSISADGRTVSFESFATNLVAADENGRVDIFVSDGRTVRVASVATDGASGDNVSSGSSLSTDGQVVAFESLATNLVETDGNGTADLFLRLPGGESGSNR